MKAAQTSFFLFFNKFYNAAPEFAVCRINTLERQKMHFREKAK